jgi:hypothetical protein
MGRAQWEIKQDTLPEMKTSKLGRIIFRFVRRPQWNQHGSHSRESKTSRLGGRICNFVMPKHFSRYYRGALNLASRQTSRD